MEPPTVNEERRRFTKRFYSRLCPVTKGASTLTSLIPLTPVGLCAQWHCNPEEWRDLQSLCERPTAGLIVQDIALVKLVRQLYDAELDLLNSFTKKYSDRTLARSAFSPIRDSKSNNPIALNSSALLRCVIDRFWTIRYPLDLRYPARIPCHNELPLGKHMGVFVQQLETWPSVMASFYRSHCALPNVGATGGLSVMESLVCGVIETGQTARVAIVESNFCSAALGLMAILSKGNADTTNTDIGKAMLANSTGKVAEAVRNALGTMKDNNLLRALHLAVVVSPVCLFGEYITGHTTRKRVTQAGLVDYFMHRGVVRDENLTLVEHYSFQAIFDMAFEGRSYFRERLPVLMKLLADMGVEDPQFESKTPVTTADLDWDRMKTQVEVSGSLKVKLSRIIHRTAEYKGRGCPVDVQEEGWLASSVLDHERIMQQFRSVTATPSTPRTNGAILVRKDTGATLVDTPALPPAIPSGPSPGTRMDDATIVDGFTRRGRSVPSRRLEYTSTPSELGSPIVLKRRTGPEEPRATHKRPRTSELPLARPSLGGDDGIMTLTTYSCKLDRTIGVIQPSSPTCWDKRSVQTRRWQGLAYKQIFLAKVNDDRILHPCEHVSVTQFYRFAWRTIAENTQRSAFASSCVHVVAIGKTTQGTDALGRPVASFDFPAWRITSWDDLGPIRSIVDTTADRVVRDLSSTESAAHSFRMSIDQFMTHRKDKVPQAIVFEAHSLNVEHLTPFLENFDDSSAYIGDELEWATHLDRKSMMPRWMSVTSGGIISDARIASSGLCTLICVVLGSMQVYVAHGEPSVVDDDWSVESWEAVYLRGGERLYIRPNTVYFTVSLCSSLLLGARFYCADTLSSTLSAVVREHFFGVDIVDGHVYGENLLTLFSLLHSWVFSAQVRLPSWAEVAALFVLIAHLDQLAPTSADGKSVWHDTDEFRADFEKAQKLLDQFWVEFKCPDLYFELGKMGTEFEKMCGAYMQQRGRLSLGVRVDTLTDRFSLRG